MKVNTDTIVFIDIETVGEHQAYQKLNNIEQSLRTKKTTYYQEKENKNAEQLYEEKAGIFAEFGKIVCICIAYHDKQGQRHEKAFYGDQEKQLLVEFADVASKRKQGFALCGHNILEFDLPYIIRRMLIQHIPLPDILQLQGKKPWEIPHIDTMNLRKCGDRKNYTSLELLAYSLGIPSPKDDIDGSMVHQTYHENNNLQRIKTYCTKDVQVTAQVYYTLTQNYTSIKHMPPL